MGSPNAKAASAARRARLEDMRRADAARDRRSKIITIALCTAVLAGVIGGGWYLLDATQAKQEAETEAAKAPLTGEKTWSKLTQNHVTKAVDYPMTPGAGGDHSQVWQNCNGNVYDKQVADENAVHSLEHGAVWVTYNDKAAESDVKTLGEKVAQTPYTLMSPYADQSSPITLTAWGRQLTVDRASDARVAQFLEKYVQGEQTPEPGAACTGGMGA